MAHQEWPKPLACIGNQVFGVEKVVLQIFGGEEIVGVVFSSDRDELEKENTTPPQEKQQIKNNNPEKTPPLLLRFPAYLSALVILESSPV